MLPSLDPIHEDEDGNWHFWDETWANRFGPYSSEEKARKALKAYSNELNHGGKEDALV